jgi:hypothetical protein
MAYVASAEQGRRDSGSPQPRRNATDHAVLGILIKLGISLAASQSSKSDRHLLDEGLPVLSAWPVNLHRE